MSEDVSVTSTPQADATPSAPATPAAATPAVNASPVATPQAPQAQATPSTPQAPEGWVPSYRIRETREAAQREYQAAVERERANARAEVERYRQQVLALTGVQPNNQNPEVDAVRSQFSRLYPGLAKIEERAADLERLIERAGDLEQQTTHYWETYGRQNLDRLFTQAEKNLGAPLNDEGKRILQNAFVGFLQSSPELERRYASDPSLVDEYAKAFTSSFVDPVRRASAATVAGRAAAISSLPQDSPSGAPRQSPVPKPSDSDERANLGWLRYQQLTQNK